jgi:hypothetical protein
LRSGRRTPIRRRRRTGTNPAFAGSRKARHLAGPAHHDCDRRRANFRALQRAGFATSAAETGASILKIMETTRHKSVDVLAAYVRRVDLFKDHAGAVVCTASIMHLHTED